MTPETNPISPDPAVRKAAVAYLDKVLDRCEAFGCEILCGPIHSAIGHFSGQGPTADEFKYGVETMRQVAEIAQRRGIRLAVEYLNRFEIYFLTTAADTARYVRAVDHPACRMMFDSFHAHIEEKDQARAIASCAAETIHVHVSENDRGIPGHRAGALGFVLVGVEGERLRRLPDDRGVRPRPARPGRGHPGLARPLPRSPGTLPGRLAFVKKNAGLS